MRLRFTVGPVQEFVRQTRRTRDLWSSSFLLSYLSGCAMVAAEKHGELILPKAADDALFKRLKGQGTDKTRIGSLPNRFEIETDDVEKAAKAATAAFHAAWMRICDTIWSETLEPVAEKGNRTKEIFDRQVNDFWEIQWVAAADEQAIKGLLERRKEWRSRIPTVEPGDKCVIMPELQELSGYVRAQCRTQQNDFWQVVKAHNELNTSELRDDERLSAIAWIKRMYPREKLVKQAIGWNPDTSTWYSTLHVAAKPWHDEVQKEDLEGADAFAKLVMRYDRDARHKDAPSDVPKFTSIDANYYFVDALENRDATLVGYEGANEVAVRKELKEALLGLYGKGATNPIGPPSSFYALLLMDGDRVGNLLAELGGETVSNALATFTKQVQGIVSDCKGETIYAGGDDVLAMLPVAGALECAWKLRDAYRGSFKTTNATTSAAIVFAHIRKPLRQVLEEAHRLLDDVAKDENGRDSIAVTVMRSGGRTLQWVTTWAGENGQSRLEGMTKLADMWSGKATRKRSGDGRALVDGEIGTGLVYRIRELMGLLCGWPRWEVGKTAQYSMGEPEKLLAAEIRRAMRANQLEDEDDTEVRNDALNMAQRMLDVCHPVVRHGDGRIEMKADHIGLDGLLLALFLSTDGKERDHGAMEGSS